MKTLHWDRFLALVTLILLLVAGCSTPVKEEVVKCNFKYGDVAGVKGFYDKCLATIQREVSDTQVQISLECPAVGELYATTFTGTEFCSNLVELKH